jgi:uncharacterized protein (TIGR03083 family)
MDGADMRATRQQRPVPAVEVARAARAARGAASQLAALLRACPDPGAAGVGRWTVRDVAAHVAGGAELYTQIARGTPSPAPTIEAITALNDQIIGTIGEQDTAALASRIEAGVAGLLAAAERCQGDPDLPWHAGVQLPLSALLAVACGEYLVHGYDIARAARRPWPVPGGWARTVFLGALPVLPYYLLPGQAPGRRARYDIRLRGEPGARVIFTVADGALAIEAPAPGQPADCHLSADPWAFLLVFYGRSGPLPPALTGKIVAWGRRPWLALTLPALFRKP